MSAIASLGYYEARNKKFGKVRFLLLLALGLVAGWLAVPPFLTQTNYLVTHIKSPNAVYNGSWITSLKVGSSRAPALMRASVAYFGLAANASEEAVYWTGLKDVSGQRLRGGHTYELRFRAAPAVQPGVGFWSLCLYNAAEYLVPNPLKRYQLGDRSPLAKNPDGSFTIIVSPTQPPEVSNWLPSPPDDQEITLQLRMYAPQPEVLQAPEKTPLPQVVRIN